MKLVQVSVDFVLNLIQLATIALMWYYGTATQTALVIAFAALAELMKINIVLRIRNR